MWSGEYAKENNSSLHKGDVFFCPSRNFHRGTFMGTVHYSTPAVCMPPRSAPVQYACDVKRVRRRTPRYPALFDRRDDTPERAKSRRWWSRRIISLSLSLRAIPETREPRTVKCAHLARAHPTDCSAKLSRLVTIFRAWFSLFISRRYFACLLFVFLFLDTR